MTDIPEDLRNANNKIKEYAELHSTEAPEYLSRLERVTHLRTLAPQMISGHLQGRFLSMISHMVKPLRILEVGTFTGYGTLCLAEGLPRDGELHTIEVNKEIALAFEEFIRKSPYSNQIICHIGDALEIIPRLETDFDLVFIDAAKTDYPIFFELTLEKTKPGGFILVDNVLWSGKVLMREKDHDTKVIDDFNKMVQHNEAVENVILPIRDGLMLCRKK